jgi:hypothetical protein
MWNKNTIQYKYKFDYILIIYIYNDNDLFKVKILITVVPIEAFRKMLTSSFPNFEEFLWTIPRQFDKFLKKFLTSCFIDQSDCSKIIYKIWLVNETGS